MELQPEAKVKRLAVIIATTAIINTNRKRGHHLSDPKGRAYRMSETVASNWRTSSWVGHWRTWADCLARGELTNPSSCLCTSR